MSVVVVQNTGVFPLDKNSDTGALITWTADGTASVNTPDIANPFSRGVTVVVNIAAISGTTPTLTVTIQGKDQASNTYYTLLASAALNATGQTVLRVYPGLVVTANQAANFQLPSIWRILATIGGGTPSVTATVGASLTQ